ncbi:MAG TPA: hypothetical protein PLV61_16670 [Parvularculaceae bacterium]|nr:hypothetical protein [Caulobacterales bacterium]HPE32830.1 hypothetical protein [Parvularculaceae bacterium]
MVDIVGSYKGEQRKRPIVFIGGSIKGSKITSDIRPAGYFGKAYLFITIGLFTMSIFSILGIIPVASVFVSFDKNLLIIVQTIIALSSIVNACLWALFSWMTFPRAHFPNMVRKSRERLIDIDNGMHHGKWRVVIDSLVALQENKQAAKSTQFE